MRLNQIKKQLGGLLLLSPLLLGNASVVQAETVLQMNNWLPPSHFVVTDVLQPWAEDVAAATDGRVKVVLTKSPLGPPARTFDLVRQGVADMGWGTQSYTPGRFLSSEGVELPFLSNTAEPLSVAYWRTHNALFDKLDEYKGVKLLSLHVQPPGELFTKDKAVRELADLKGLKMRIVGPVTSAVMEQGDGVAVSAPISQIYELTSSGVIDGTFLTTDSIPQMKLTDYLHHRTTVDGGFYNTSFFLVMNEKAWNKLSAEDQKAIEALSGEAFAKRISQVWDAKRDYGAQQFAVHGGSHVQIEGKDLENLTAQLQGLRDAWKSKMAEKGVDGEAALEMITNEVSAYKAQ